MLPVLYSEVNILCILIIVLVMHKLHKSVDMRSRKMLFVRVMISVLLFFIIDLIWVHVDNKFIEVALFANWFLNGVYFILTGIMGYCWFHYSESVQESVCVKNRRNRLLSMIPLLILILLTLTSFRTGALFYIDEENRYHRGPLYFLQVTISYGYMIFTAVKASIGAFKTSSYTVRRDYLTLSSFVALPIIFGTLQIVFQGIPLLCIGITLGVLSVYMEFQEQLISLDPLTQINNRNQLRRYLSGKMQHMKEVSNLYLLMMDVDYFKKINDQYGHVEGDKALIRVSEAMKQSCRGKNHFLARFGGDEFVIICEAQDEQEVKTLCQTLQENVVETNHAANASYPLSLSIGYAKYSPKYKTIQEFMNAADIELYKIKKSRK